MAEIKKHDIEIFWQRASVTERFSLPIYPINVGQLLPLLPSIGYIVPDLVLRGTPEEGKPMAMRGNSEIAINTDNKTIGVRDISPESAVNSFTELREFYMTHLDPAPLDVQYIEFDGTGIARSKDSPLKVISRFWRDTKGFGKIGAIFGEDVTNYGFDICPRDQEPNNPKWFHIVIKPAIPSGSKEYSFRWIWREPPSDQLIKKFSRVTDSLRSVISGLQE